MLRNQVRKSERFVLVLRMDSDELGPISVFEQPSEGQLEIHARRRRERAAGGDQGGQRYAAKMPVQHRVCGHGGALGP
jgi:hypothetical protein